MGLIRQITKAAIQALLPGESFVTRGSGPGVSLTFDDGPHPEHTPRLLDALAEARIRATFFVVGERAQCHLELVRRIVDAWESCTDFSQCRRPSCYGTVTQRTTG